MIGQFERAPVASDEAQPINDKRIKYSDLFLTNWRRKWEFLSVNLSVTCVKLQYIVANNQPI